MIEQQRQMYEVPMQLGLEQINEFLSKMYDIVTSMDHKVTEITKNLHVMGPISNNAAPAANDQSIITHMNSLLYMSKETL